MKKEWKIAGAIALEYTVDITDPCYSFSKDVWYRTTLPSKPGTYECSYCIVDTGEWGKRVSKSRIYCVDVEGIQELLNDPASWDYGIYEIGVDAGLAGYFNDKPDFGDLEWMELCNKMLKDGNHAKAWIDSWDGKDGFWTRSGYGDGSYEVDVIWDPNNKDQIVAAQIAFI